MIDFNDALALYWKLLQKKSHRHEFVLHTGTKNLGGLVQDAGNLVQARNVVLIVLDRIERDRKRKIGEAGVHPVLLIDRHLIFFEIEVRDALLEHTNQKIVREPILIGKTVRR